RTGKRLRAPVAGVQPRGAVALAGPIDARQHAAVLQQFQPRTVAGPASPAGTRNGHANDGGESVETDGGALSVRGATSFDASRTLKSQNWVDCRDQHSRKG